MSTVAPKAGVPGRLFLVAAGLVLLALCVAKPISLLFPAAILCASATSTIAACRRHRRLAAERAGESICTFARAFERRATDTWTLRAVHGAISELVAFPVRADDRFAEELALDVDDVEDVAEIVALRVGRPLVACDQNRMYGKIRTVRDLVAFSAGQRRAGDVRPRSAGGAV